MASCSGHHGRDRWVLTRHLSADDAGTKGKEQARAGGIKWCKKDQKNGPGRALTVADFCRSERAE